MCAPAPRAAARAAVCAIAASSARSATGESGTGEVGLPSTEDALWSSVVVSVAVIAASADDGVDGSELRLQLDRLEARRGRLGFAEEEVAEEELGLPRARVPELDPDVHAAGARERGVEPLEVVRRHEAALSRGDAVERGEEPRQREHVKVTERGLATAPAERRVDAGRGRLDGRAAARRARPC
jgi:hypothetical protein